MSAWEAACNKTRENAKISVGSGKTYLVSEIQFQGPCSSTSITFEVTHPFAITTQIHLIKKSHNWKYFIFSSTQILGNIVAPPRSAWQKKGSNEWLYFHRVDGLTVVGERQGVIDGRGETWWKNVRPLKPLLLN